ncbi:hypothetical protein E1B28_003712 [Marasmius oreades]|uniref:Uncharacterized protein n=1 Tax=Marasmius oreades TaxID=181124 RepID=A0A9P7UX45_9AGAR|nr:uncharacterized protein E1B28_003712 [Marasmius oreades]KAG7096264.1 hypothetical protein E1B28_003712 [Marasmius oreades]
MKNFQEASGISMQTAIFNEIGGNQITNHYTIREERDRNIYDEFRHIRLGDVEMIRELTLGKYNRGGLFTAMVHCGQGYKCTVLSYSGPNAKAEWERDFREVTGLRNPRTMQLFGINQSNVPLLIFHNELVPLGHVWNDLPILGQVYFATLAEFHFQCKRERLWIDPKRGSLIYGMWGPDSKYVGRLESDLPMSSNTDLLQEDVFWRYLSGIKPSDREYDNQITHELSEQYDWCQHIDRSTDLAGVNGVYSTLATSRIAVISTGWHYGCFDDTVLMPDGATRFTLHNLRDTGCFELKTDWWYNQRAWVSQAPAVFHELGVSLDKDLNNFGKFPLFWFLIDTDPFQSAQCAKA